MVSVVVGEASGEGGGEGGVRGLGRGVAWLCVCAGRGEGGG